MNLLGSIKIELKEYKESVEMALLESEKHVSKKSRAVQFIALFLSASIWSANASSNDDTPSFLCIAEDSIGFSITQEEDLKQVNWKLDKYVFRLLTADEISSRENAERHIAAAQNRSVENKTSRYGLFRFDVSAGSGIIFDDCEYRPESVTQLSCSDDSFRYAEKLGYFLLIEDSSFDLALHIESSDIHIEFVGAQSMPRSEAALTAGKCTKI